MEHSRREGMEGATEKAGRGAEEWWESKINEGAVECMRG